VRTVGLSNDDVEQLARAPALGHVDSLQPGLSVLNRQALAEDIPWCAAHATGVIVYGPLQRGVLSGAFSKARAAAVPADDWRAASPDFRDYVGSRMAGACRIPEKRGSNSLAGAWAVELRHVLVILRCGHDESEVLAAAALLAHLDRK
jgi:aryl-alcohol dehydrogenase-like predicted oxidoreductase